MNTRKKNAEYLIVFDAGFKIHKTKVHLEIHDMAIQDQEQNQKKMLSNYMKQNIN